MLRFRLADHRGYITNGDVTQATGAHFNMPGHSLADFSATIIEQSKKKNCEYRKEREQYFIRKFDTFHKGITDRDEEEEEGEVLVLFDLLSFIT